METSKVVLRSWIPAIVLGPVIIVPFSIYKVLVRAIVLGWHEEWSEKIMIVAVPAATVLAVFWVWLIFFRAEVGIEHFGVRRFFKTRTVPFDKVDRVQILNFTHRLVPGALPNALPFFNHLRLSGTCSESGRRVTLGVNQFRLRGQLAYVSQADALYALVDAWVRANPSLVQDDVTRAVFTSRGALRPTDSSHRQPTEDELRAARREAYARAVQSRRSHLQWVTSIWAMDLVFWLAGAILVVLFDVLALSGGHWAFLVAIPIEAAALVVLRMGWRKRGSYLRMLATGGDVPRISYSTDWWNPYSVAAGVLVVAGFVAPLLVPAPAAEKTAAPAHPAHPRTHAPSATPTPAPGRAPAAHLPSRIAHWRIVRGSASRTATMAGRPLPSEPGFATRSATYRAPHKPPMVFGLLTPRNGSHKRFDVRLPPVGTLPRFVDALKLKDQMLDPIGTLTVLCGGTSSGGTACAWADSRAIGLLEIEAGFSARKLRKLVATAHAASER